MKKAVKQTISLYLKGVAMGAADVVPGVSGGTVAFITGIYEDLLDSIKSFNLPTAKLFLKGEFKAAWRSVNGPFLFVLLSGIATSVLSLAKVIKLGLDKFPEFIWAFFFGLIIASAILVAQEIKGWNYKTLISLVMGIITASVLTNITPATTPESYWFIFLAGSIAICAMILPGISGAFILLLLGKYEFVLDAINTRNIPVIVVFGAGAIVGLISFSNLLSWLLKKHKNNTIGVLAGFMIGSLGVVWPWKHPIYKISANGHEVFTPSGKPVIQGYEHYLPETIDWQTVTVFGLMVVGLVTIFGIERLALKINEADNEFKS